MVDIEVKTMSTALPYQLEFLDGRDPAGPDGRGWNRLSLNTLSPTNRCMLRPNSQQACLDLARGMARHAPITSYSPCEGSECGSCRFNQRRDAWQHGWVVAKDPQRDGVWLMGSRDPGTSGHYFAGWESLAQSIDLPELARVLDPHWGTLYVARSEVTA